METLGRYRIVRELGEGGMGVVYAAHDDRLDRPVAIKRIRAGLGDGQERQRLWREARAAASVNHPNVCQLYEIDEDGEGLFLAMELLEGEPLSARLARGPLAPGEAVQYLPFTARCEAARFWTCPSVCQSRWTRGIRFDAAWHPARHAQLHGA